MENKLRGLINVIYFSKTVDIVNVSLRQIIENSLKAKNDSLAQEIKNNMNK